MEDIFSEKDLAYLASKGYELEKIKQQLAFFQKGVAPLHLVKSATIGDGIQQLNSDEKLFFSQYFESQRTKYQLEKFVPASGAASRMFQFLIAFLNDFDPKTDTLTGYTNKTGNQNLNVFIVGIRKFPFHAQLKEKTKMLFPEYSTFSRDQKVHAIIYTLLHKTGLDFASKPKGILPFHWRNNQIITPVEEHIVEAQQLIDFSGECRIHFTIPREFQSDFDALVSKYAEVSVHFSYQNQASDTLAVDENNKPFRLSDGTLLFRPAGHGALIANLNQVEADVILIKNIDNVSQAEQEQSVFNQKVLAGILLHLQNQIFDYLRQLQHDVCDVAVINEIKLFVEERLSFPVPEEFQMFQTAYQIEYLTKILNRPIRVCGMVKNEGEPGGGPFWVQDKNGRITLQIVETAQIDLGNELQKNCVNSATHFNPVDMVCGVKNVQGQKFDLTEYIDQEAVIITQKTILGQPIKAIELPGLWNGAMAQWTTIFVEVPLATFNPVKSVNDLLKPAHQPVFET
jgi:hypothetical protein